MATPADFRKLFDAIDEFSREMKFKIAANLTTEYEGFDELHNRPRLIKNIRILIDRLENKNDSHEVDVAIYAMILWKVRKDTITLKIQEKIKEIDGMSARDRPTDWTDIK